jgi:VIT1/CCC1 family predicted Fe2+/Mn2+ transporter
MTEPRNPALDRALDETLGRTLSAPDVPQTFRTRLNAALSRSAETDLASLRERLQNEQRQQLEELEQHYIRVRGSTLGTLIGIAFAAGAAVTIAMPWLHEHLGSYTPMAITWGGAALGLGMVFRDSLRTLLRRLG